MWRQDTTAAAEPRAKISRAGLRWGLVGIVVQDLSMARVAEGLGVSWNTAIDAVLAEGQRLLVADLGRLDGVRVVGVDEHVWRHTRKGDKYVTVVIGLFVFEGGVRAARRRAGWGRDGSRSPIRGLLPHPDAQGFEDAKAYAGDEWRNELLLALLGPDEAQRLLTRV